MTTAAPSTTREQWLFTYLDKNGSVSHFGRPSRAGLAAQRRWFLKRFPSCQSFKIEPNWPLRVSQELSASGGPAEERLRKVCRARCMTRTAVILAMGDPRRWAR